MVSVVQQFPQEGEDHLQNIGSNKRRVLDRFRSLVKANDVENTKIPFEKSDYCLLRFLKARKFDLEKAMKMWVDHVNWNNQFKCVADAKDEDVSGGANLAVICRLYPTAYSGCDRKGRPLMIKRFGHCNIVSLIQHCGNNVENVVAWEAKYSMKMKNVFAYYSHLSGHHVETFCSILDMEGSSMSQFSNEVWDALKLTNELTSANFPESLGILIVINAPLYFRVVWGLVKKFVDPRTFAKFRLFGSDYHTDLHQYVHPDNLPIEYHGTGKLGLQTLDDLYTPEKAYGIFRIAEEYVHERRAGRPTTPGGPSSLPHEALPSFEFRTVRTVMGNATANPLFKFAEVETHKMTVYANTSQSSSMGEIGSRKTT